MWLETNQASTEGAMKEMTSTRSFTTIRQQARKTVVTGEGNNDRALILRVRSILHVGEAEIQSSFWPPADHSGATNHRVCSGWFSGVMPRLRPRYVHSGLWRANSG